MVYLTYKGKPTSNFHRIVVSIDMPGFVDWEEDSQATLHFIGLEGRDVFVSVGRKFEVRRSDKDSVNRKSAGLRFEPHFGSMALGKTLPSLCYLLI